MHRNYFKWIMIIAAGCLLLVLFFMWNEKPSRASSLAMPLSQITQRAALPFRSYISAVGIVEASSENINIGSPVDRVVDAVDVKVGEKVKKGQILFRLESRDLAAELLTRRIAFENARANLQKMESLPRPEDLAVAEAELKSVQVEFEQAKGQYQRVAGLQNSGAMSLEDVSRRLFAFDEASAKLEQAKAQLTKIKAGAWLPDVEIARLQVMQAKADMQRVEAAIERTTIRAPIDGTVLQLKIHEGEYPPAESSRSPALIIGDTEEMHLRVSINQFDASFYRSAAPAVAYLQGNAKEEFPLQFVRLEPYFVTKQNLTNDINEKVDTRVLQVIYTFKQKNPQVFVGQLMDVFIDNEDMKPQ